MKPLKIARKILRMLAAMKLKFIPYALNKLGLYFMPDDEYLSCIYKYAMGRELDLENPKTFTEKLQWLKLYDRRPEYTALADKYEAKKFIADTAGSKYVIQTLGVWDKFDDIDFDALPSQFVLKCTHDSGSVIVVPDKSSMNMKQARKILTQGLRRNFYYQSREWVYKDIKPRIIAEEYISGTLEEYKIFCFDGKPGLILVCKGKAHAEGRTNDFYDMDFKHIPVSVTYPNSKTLQLKPSQLGEMLQIASRLSAGIPQIRIDLYLAEGKIYVGELTFYHEAGHVHFKPELYDEKFGELITLPAEKRC